MAKAGFKRSSRDTRIEAAPKSFETRANAISVDYDKDKNPRKKRLDPISDVIGASDQGYYYKMRWSWLTQEFGGINYPLEVTRYYPKINLALDISTQESDETLELKKKLMALHGITYKILNHPNDLAALQGATA